MALEQEELDLFKAAEDGAVMRIAEIVARDPQQVNAYNAHGWTPLHLACFYGHFAAAKYLLDAGAAITALSRNPMGNHPLHAAIAGRTSFEIVELLVARGANASAASVPGYTPLHLAASRGSRELVDLLIRHGADPLVRTHDSRDAAAIAYDYGHPELAGWLRSAHQR